MPTSATEINFFRPFLSERSTAAGIQGFPTWEIGNKQFQGEKTLKELVELSDYKEPRSFQNQPLEGH
jgi:hypothetical protein